MVDSFNSDDWEQDSDEIIHNPHGGFQGPSRVSSASSWRTSTFDIARKSRH
jgi:hypothetical protein